MIRIAIVTRQMITGGVEKALLSMLSAMLGYDVSVDLYLQNMGGELFDEIPEWANVFELKTLPAKEMFKHPILAVRKAKCLFRLQRSIPYVEQCQISSQMLLPIKETYDIAIAYHAPNTVPVFYVIDKINAKSKILWLHGDMETNGGDNPISFSYHEKYDRVFCVSKAVYDSYIRIHPDKREAAEVFYNFVNADSLEILAQKGDTFPEFGYHILTIGRLSKQKGIDIAIEACLILVKKGYRFHWYVCGGGEEINSLRKKICDSKLDDIFILLGNQSNPYTYLKDCDLYVQTSRFEGYCTTTNEARNLGKPVITTEVSGATEQFTDGVTGWIVPIDAGAIAEKIAWCMDHPNEVKVVTTAMQKSISRNKQEVERIWN